MTREVLFTLQNARIDLFPIKEGSAVREWIYGAPDGDNPFLSGYKAESLSVIKQTETADRRPSGAQYPIPRQSAVSYQIVLTGLLAPVREDDGDESGEFNDSGSDPFLREFRVDPNQMFWIRIAFLDTENDELTWKSILFGGVLASEHGLNSDEIYHFAESISLQAPFMKEKSGTGEIPQVSL